MPLVVKDVLGKNIPVGFESWRLVTDMVELMVILLALEARSGIATFKLVWPAGKVAVTAESLAEVSMLTSVAAFDACENVMVRE